MEGNGKKVFKLTWTFDPQTTKGEADFGNDPLTWDFVMSQVEMLRLHLEEKRSMAIMVLRQQAMQQAAQDEMERQIMAAQGRQHVHKRLIQGK